jgi:hypothetical protein
LALVGTALASDKRRDDTLSIRVNPISLDVRGDTVRIAYLVTNTQASPTELFMFTVDAPAPALKVEKPAPPTRWDMDVKKKFGRSVALWAFIEPTLAPGNTSPPLAFSALGLPGIVKYWGEPWIPPDTVETADVPASSVRPPSPGNSAADSGLTVGVVPFPRDRSRAALLVRLSGFLTDVCARGWVDNQGICSSLRVKIQHDETRALLNELEAQRGKHVNDLAYFLLAGNVWALPAS